MKKQQQQANEKSNANSETVTTLIPSLSIPTVAIWNDKICLLKEEWLRLASSRCNSPPPLQNQAHSLDSTVIFTGTLQKLFTCVWLAKCKNCELNKVQKQNSKPFLSRKRKTSISVGFIVYSWAFRCLNSDWTSPWAWGICNPLMSNDTC